MSLIDDGCVACGDLDPNEAGEAEVTNGSGINRVFSLWEGRVKKLTASSSTGLLNAVVNAPIDTGSGIVGCDVNK